MSATRLKRHSLAWWRRQRRLRDAVRRAMDASAKWAPPKLSGDSKREIDELLRDLVAGEGG